jgi:hypothetical protein
MRNSKRIFKINPVSHKQIERSQIGAAMRQL